MQVSEKKKEDKKMKKFLHSKFAKYTAWSLLLAFLIQVTPVQAFASMAREKKQHKDAPKPQPAVRTLSLREMSMIRGAGDAFAGHPGRSMYYNGTMPWQKSFRDVNLCNGNLFKSFTDIQVAPARGAGLVLQRTYNSNDYRIGPFGRGWTHAYDIRMEESPDPSTMNTVDKTDFFGGKHKFSRDADGLYTPPSYLHSTLNSDYNETLTNGPVSVNNDIEEGTDGTIKHYITYGNANYRVCDYIQDKHFDSSRPYDSQSNPMRTILTYDTTDATDTDGSTIPLLSTVRDPSGRTLTFTWQNFDTTLTNPSWRIVEIQGPSYSVAYTYYTNAADPNAGGELYNLKSVTLDPEGENRVTSFTYTSTQYNSPITPGESGQENGLLASVRIQMPAEGSGGSQDQVTSYTYGLLPQFVLCPLLPGEVASYEVTDTLWVTSVTEPSGNAGNNGEMCWNIGAESTLDDGTAWSGYVGVRPQADPSKAYAGLNTGVAVAVCVDDCGHVSHMDNIGPMDVAWSATGRWFQYDGSNNLTGEQHCAFTNDYRSSTTADAWMPDYYQYNRIGSVSQHRFWTYDDISSAYPVQGEDHDYYDDCKYFHKKSDTVWLNNTSFLKTNYDYGSRDDLPGNRGNMMWVQDPNGGMFSYQYNATTGQKVQETNANGVVTQYHYDDPFGDLTSVVQDAGGAGHLNRTTTMFYDLDGTGQVVQKIDPSGNKTNIEYNSLGQPTDVYTYPSGSTSPQEHVQYSYGSNGRMVSVTDQHYTGSTVTNSRTTTIAYEIGCDRVSSVSETETSNGTTLSIGTVSYTYDQFGAVKTKKFPKQIDAQGPHYRQWNYHYDDDIETQPQKYQPLQGLIYGACLLPYTFVTPDGDPDKTMETLSSIEDVPVDPGDTAPSNLVNFLVDPRGAVVWERFNQQFDSTGAPTQYCDRFTSPYVDPLSGVCRGWTGSVVTYLVNGYQLQQRTILSSNTYTYDDIGNRTQNNISIAASGTNPAISTTEQYGYDNLNRLTNVDYGDGHTQSYTFDAMGNRLSKTDSAAGTTEMYQYDNANRLLSRGRYAYANDADGNTTHGYAASGQTINNTWDCQNRLISSSISCLGPAQTKQTTYEYGADGLRRTVTTNANASNSTTMHFIYDGQNAIQVLKEVHHPGGGTDLMPVSTYLTGPNGPMYRYDAESGNTSWYLYDGLGSVIGEVNSSGQITARNLYDVYGQQRGGDGSPTTRHKFCGALGHTTDDLSDESGYIYMRARYMDPVTGRFISEDPGRNGSNWYAYANCSPVNSVDRDGKCAVLIAAVLISALISGLCAMINSSDPWRAFKTGFAAGLVTGAACLCGPLVGAVVGAAVGGIAAYLNGVRGPGVWVAAAIGLVAGGMGGAADASLSTGIFGAVDKLTIQMYTCQAAIGVLCGSGQSIAGDM